MPIDLRHLLRAARRWWWLLLLAPMIGGITAFTVSERQPEMYSASATLLVSAGVTTSNFGSVQAGQNLTDTYSLWAVSYPVLERSAEVLEYEGGANALAENIEAVRRDHSLWGRHADPIVLLCR